MSSYKVKGIFCCVQDSVISRQNANVSKVFPEEQGVMYGDKIDHTIILNIYVH